MLATVNRQLRRHRRHVLIAAVVLVVALTGLGAHAALMSGPMGDHAMSGAAVICLAVGGLAVIGGIVFAMRRLLQRPRWLIPAPAAPALALAPAATGFSIRAGPPPLLQVFRL